MSTSMPQMPYFFDHCWEHINGEILKQYTNIEAVFTANINTPVTLFRASQLHEWSCAAPIPVIIRRLADRLMTTHGLHFVHSTEDIILAVNC